MSFKTGDITRGGQLALLRFRMFMQINNVLFYYVVIGWLLIVSCVIYLRLNTEVFYNGVHFWWAQSLIPFTEIMKSPPTFELWYKGKTYIFTWEQMLTDPYAVWCGLKLRDEVVTCLLVSSVLVAAFYGVVFSCLHVLAVDKAGMKSSQGAPSSRSKPSPGCYASAGRRRIWLSTNCRSRKMPRFRTLRCMAPLAQVKVP